MMASYRKMFTLICYEQWISCVIASIHQFESYRNKISFSFRKTFHLQSLQKVFRLYSSIRREVGIALKNLAAAAEVRIGTVVEFALHSPDGAVWNDGRCWSTSSAVDVYANNRTSLRHWTTARRYYQFVVAWQRPAEVKIVKNNKERSVRYCC